MEELFHRFERPGFFRSFSGKKMSGVLGLDGLPMIHHYSWVRTEKEFLKKIGSWGHKHDLDWREAPHHEIFGFKKPMHVYPFCNPLEVPIEELTVLEQYRYLSKETFPHLTLIDPYKLKNISINNLILDS